MKIIDVDFTNEPQEDFSNPEVRRSIDNALSEYEERRKKNLADNKIIPPIIDGKTYDASHGNIITVFDPADTARALGKVTFADQECIERACSVARDAYFRSMQNFASPSRFDDWIKEKKAVVQEYIQITREERYDIATEMINEVSKSQKGAFAEIEETIDFGEIYLRLVDDVFALYRYQPKLRAESNYCRNKPRGPSLLIKAWNYAFSLPSEAVLASYITGCPPLLKPAPQSSLVGYRVVDIMRRAIKKVGADPGMVAYLPGDRDVGEALVRHPFIANITLTGSLKAGKRINRVAAEVLDENPYGFPFGFKKVDLELGGNNFIIVTESALTMIDDILRWFIDSKFEQAGQKCSTDQRIIFVGPEEAYQECKERLKDAVSSLGWGHPADTYKRPDYNPVIDKPAFDRIQGRIEECEKVKKPFMKITLSELERNGYFIGPAVFEDLPHDSMEMVGEEVFGPFLSLHHTATLDEAMRMGNVYPHITAGIFTQSEKERGRFIEWMTAYGKGGLYYVNRKIIHAMTGRNIFVPRNLSGSGCALGTLKRLLWFTDQVGVTENNLIQGVLSNV